MAQHSVENITFRVRIGEGHLIGDILKKYATRRASSWKIAGFKIDSNSVNFGFSDGKLVSYLEYVKAVLVCSSEQISKEPIIATFSWNGECFEYKDFKIYNLNPSVGKTIEVCLVYASGCRTADENFEEIRKLLGDEAERFLSVPSSHSEVHTFKYKVEPYDDQMEDLTITADIGVVDLAIKTVSESIQRLRI